MEQGYSSSHLTFSRLPPPPNAFDGALPPPPPPGPLAGPSHPPSYAQGHGRAPEQAPAVGLMKLSADFERRFEEAEERQLEMKVEDEGEGEGLPPKKSAKSRGKKKKDDGAGAAGGRAEQVVLDKDGQPKKKRKQLVACDSCRLRRVKCDKADMDGGACTECQRKSIICTDSYVRNKPKVVRGGKLISKAKELYGDQNSESPVDGQPPAGILSPVSPTNVDDFRRSSAASDQQQQLLVMPPKDGRIMSQSVRRDIAHQLIQTYFSTIHPQCPLVDQELFMKAYEATGYVVENLCPAYECLALVLQAWAARFSDDPTVAGPGSPSLTEYRTSQPGRDFTLSGNRREEVALAMREQALKAIDRHGLLRRSSPAACAALTLLEFLYTWDDPRRRTTAGRYLMHGAVEHLRNLQAGYCDEPGEECIPPERASNGTLLWLIYTRDALCSVMGGRNCALTEDDLTSLCDLFTNPITANVEAYVSSNDSRMLSGLAVAAIFRFGTNSARNTVTKLTGPLARRQRTTEATVHSIWAEIDELSRYGAVFRQSVESVSFGPETPRTDVWFRDLIVVKSQHTLGIHLHLVSRLEEEESAPPELNKDGGAYLDLLRRLKAQSDIRLLAVSREFTRLLQSYGRELMFSAAYSVEYSEEFLGCMVSVPAYEQGGVEDWTWENKVAEISSLIEALKLIGWAWAGCDRLIESARASLAEQGAQLRRHSNPRYPPTPDYDSAPRYPSDPNYRDPSAVDWRRSSYASSSGPAPTGLVDYYAPQQQPPPPPPPLEQHRLSHSGPPSSYLQAPPNLPSHPPSSYPPPPEQPPYSQPPPPSAHPPHLFPPHQQQHGQPPSEFFQYALYPEQGAEEAYRQPQQPQRRSPMPPPPRTY